ncbi:hypothetical protein Q762_08310 [Flavobacterium cauense R2A-7]|nr:hypothetical protein Q762_08310 [Flavobacterium cauense R2A-7]
MYLIRKNYFAKLKKLIDKQKFNCKKLKTFFVFLMLIYEEEKQVFQMQLHRCEIEMRQGK